MITYNAEGVKMPKFRHRDTTSWIMEVAFRHRKLIGEVGYLFVSDEIMLEKNREYLGHDYYTDILTFDYTERNTLNGDIIISVDTVRSNAELFSKDFDDELHRVIIHGILHLCGFTDKSPHEREIMEGAEDRALALLPR